MAIEFNRKSYSGHFPEFWRGEAKILPGGFKPSQEFPVGTVVHKGVPLCVDFDNMTAAVCKTATVVTGGTTTSPRVAKGHLFVVGDYVAKSDTTENAVQIKSIDTSNADYDVITFSKALTGVAAGNVIFESEETITEAATSKYVPNFVVGSERKFDGKGLPTFDAAYDVVVLIPALGAPMLPEWLNGVCLKNNPNILYIKQ